MNENKNSIGGSDLLVRWLSDYPKTLGSIPAKKRKTTTLLFSYVGQYRHSLLVTSLQSLERGRGGGRRLRADELECMPRPFFIPPQCKRHFPQVIQTSKWRGKIWIEKKLLRKSKKKPFSKYPDKKKLRVRFKSNKTKTLNNVFSKTDRKSTLLLELLLWLLLLYFVCQ